MEQDYKELERGGGIDYEEEQDVYNEDYLEQLQQDDGINEAQEGFMVGYLADL